MLINIFEQAPNIGVMHTGHGSHLYSSHSKHIDEAHFHPLNLFLLKKKKKKKKGLLRFARIFSGICNSEGFCVQPKVVAICVFIAREVDSLQRWCFATVHVRERQEETDEMPLCR